MHNVHEMLYRIHLSATRVLSENMTETGLPPWESALPNAITTAELLSAILETGGWPGTPSINALVDTILSSQLPTGHWSDANSEDPWDVSSTAWVYWAFRNIDSVESRAASERAVQWLESVALPDGGFPANTGNSEANSYATAYAFRALRNSGKDEAATASLSYLKSCQNEDGGWGLKPGDSSEATLTCYVLHGLFDGNENPDQEPIASALRWLLNARSKNGTWGSWLDETTSVEGTAFSLFILSRTPHNFGALDVLGVKYIFERVAKEDPWNIDGVVQNWMAITGIIASHALRAKFP